MSIAILIVLLLWSNALWAAPRKVALFPFQMNAAQDLTYLQNGMFTMLSSRLTDPGKTVVIDRGTVEQALEKAMADGIATAPLSEDSAKMVGLSLNADYVLFGSITAIGQSVSLDASLADVTGEQPAFSFSDQSEVLGNIISMANNFAVTVNQTVFNRSGPHKIRPIARQGQAVDTQDVPAVIPAAGGALQPVFQEPDPGFLTLGQFKDIVVALAVADFNGNGTAQVATASGNTLSFYHLGGSGLVLEKTVTYPSHIDIVGLDSGDINGNGYPEIFVSAITVHQDSIASFVVEFSGGAYRTLTEEEPFYFKVVDDQNGKKMLLGQKKAEDPFDGNIHLMSAKGRGYAVGKRIAMPRGTSVLALDRGFVRSAGEPEFLSLNRHDKLVVVSATGKDAWQSTLRYGGTKKAWLLDREDEDESYRERVYFQPRLKFFDGDKERDGAQQAIVIKNSELMGGVVGRYKKFTQGHLEIMAWNGMEMQPVYKTAPVQGWISDFALADLDNNGQQELLVTVVGRSKFSILSVDKASTLISYAVEP